MTLKVWTRTLNGRRYSLTRSLVPGGGLRFSAHRWDGVGDAHADGHLGPLGLNLHWTPLGFQLEVPATGRAWGAVCDALFVLLDSGTQGLDAITAHRAQCPNCRANDVRIALTATSRRS